MKKVLLGAAAVVAVLAVAMVLFGSKSGSAEAAVTSITLTPTTGLANSSAPGNTISLNIDAAEAGGNVTIVATGGEFAAGSLTCDDNATDGTAAAACALTGGSPALPTSSPVIDDAASAQAGGTDTIIAVFTCTGAGPSTPVVTVIQGSSVKTVTLKCRGPISSLEVFARSAAATGSANAGSAVSYVRATGATQGQANANINASSVDSAGNRLVGQTFIFVTTDGTLSATAVTAASADTWVTSSLTADATVLAGDTETVTVASAGQTATVSVNFSGNAKTCFFTDSAGATVSSITVQSGQILTFGVNWVDSSGGPIADKYATTNGSGNDVQAINPGGAGTFVFLSSGSTSAGKSTVKLVVSATGGTAVLGLLATTPCNLQVVVDAAVTAAATTATTGIVGALPASGFGLVTFGGSIAELQTALVTACPSGAPIFSTDYAGNFVPYVGTSAVSAVNAAFNALYPSGLSAGTPLLGGNCG
jgi:hypothetical protein